jgi:GntR family transcriptional repressor for pyruvate dehydrogenase complex
VATTRGEEVSDRLIAEIQAGTFAQGEKLPTEPELMARYGVGRNTLREAIRGLVALGLVDVRPGAGTTVKRVDGANALQRSVTGALLQDAAILDLFEFRLMLETDAAAHAASRANDEDHRAIGAALAAYQRAVRDSHDVYAHDVAFHRSIAAATHNAIYVTVIDTTTNLLMASMEDADRHPGDVAAAAAEHALIAHHIALGDAAQAQAAMRAHLIAGEERRTIGPDRPVAPSD